MNGEDTMSQTSVNVGARSVPDSDGALGEDKGVARSELPSSSVIIDNRASYEGYLNYSFGALEPAETGAFRWSTESLPALTSRGEKLSYVVSNDGLTLTAETPDGMRVFEIVVDNVLSGHFNATRYRGLDHDNPLLQDGFSFNVGDSLIVDAEYVLTDSEGNTASSALRLQFNDSRPSTHSDHVDANEGATSVSWNVLDNDSGRLDGLALYRAKVEGGDEVGQVSFTTDGEITFIPNNEFVGLATILYDAVDGDGDMVREVFTVLIIPGPDKPVTPDLDGDDSTRNPAVVLWESHIDDVKGVLVKKGFLGYDFGLDGPGRFTWHIDDLPNLTTESGSSVTWSITRNGRQIAGHDDNGDRVILIQLPDVENGAFKVALFQPLDHDSVGAEYLSFPGNIDLDVGYTIYDSYAVNNSEGDSASGVLHINIRDNPTVASARAYRADDDVTAEPSVATSDVSALVAPVASALVSPDISVLASPVDTPVAARFSGSASSTIEVETDRLIEDGSSSEGSSSFEGSASFEGSSSFQGSSSIEGGYSFNANASFDASTSGGYFLNMGSGFDASSSISWEGRFGDKVVTFDLDAERVAEVGQGTLTSSGSVEVALSISDLLDDSDEGDVLLTMEASQDSHLESQVAGHVTGSSGQGADSTSSIDAQASSSVQAPGLALASGFQWGSDNPLGQWLGESNLIHE